MADLGLLLVGTFRDEALEPGRPLAAALGQTIARLPQGTPARAADPASRAARGAGKTYNFGRYDFPGLSLYSLETRGLDVATPQGLV